MTSNLHHNADNFDCSYCQLPERDPRQRDRQVNRPLAFNPSQFARGDDQSRIRLILIGYPEDINQEILTLYHCGYDINAWSPPQAIPDSGEVVRVYTKRRRRV